MATKKTETTTETKGKEVALTVGGIKPPNLQILQFLIRGTSPYVQNKFSQKALEKIKETQQAGQVARGKKVREPKDFQANFENAKYRMKDGSYGIPAPAFRNGLISACRLVGFHMTKAKISLFVMADGVDVTSHKPLVRLDGEPEYFEDYVRNESGVVDLRARPIWNEWEAKLHIRYDADQFNASDVANLLQRVGMQIGVGEGRYDSKNSAGMGWGCFEIA
jgi:hypothetical protein